MKKLVQMAAAAAAASISLMVPAHASEVSVELLNKAGERRFVFSPELVRINPGDTVVFVPTDKGHNTVSIDGMLPEGAERINIGFNREGAVTLDRPGIDTPVAREARLVARIGDIETAVLESIGAPAGETLDLTTSHLWYEIGPVTRDMGTGETFEMSLRFVGGKLTVPVHVHEAPSEK